MVLRPQPQESVLDCTLGLGGHALLLWQRIAPEGALIGLEADPRNLALARDRLHEAGDHARMLHANFRDIATLGLTPVDIVFADLGLSSPHIDDPQRGFTFRQEAPLDLRFDPTSGESAGALIARLTEDELAEIFRHYGELYPQARKLGRVLAGKVFVSTIELRTAVEAAFGFRAKALLPQVFQALRIAVNDEIAALTQLLLIGPTLLKPGGRMAVLSYHSLEDRPVKQTFRALCEPEKDPLTGKIARAAPFRSLTRKPVRASEEEVARNPRSRSALLRAIERLPL